MCVSTWLLVASELEISLDKEISNSAVVEVFLQFDIVACSLMSKLAEFINY